MPAGAGAGEVERWRVPRRAADALADARLVAELWARYARVRWALRTTPLPLVVAALDRPDPGRAHQPPPRLSRAVHRALRLGPWRPRCIHTALVLYGLLRAQGDAAELVIGLRPEAADHEAHAWVESRQRVVGPPPGRRGHDVLARYPTQRELPSAD